MSTFQGPGFESTRHAQKWVWWSEEVRKDSGLCGLRFVVGGTSCMIAHMGMTLVAISLHPTTPTASLCDGN